ncbi:MAG: hypothetical protein B7Y39_13040 [Bdellovibrio sp. 28-41-41]|nr:MAG: hypothetical protein B7Y39_13040 [Bdellovibrio sp. 28-41-41]
MLKVSFLLFACVAVLSSCAVLHSVQIGEIESSPDLASVPFEIKVSEFGIDLNDVKTTGRILMDKNSSDKANDALTAIQYFQMGPHTGAGVYSINYVDHLENKVREQCPSGRITGLMSIRETAEYPIVKGEIVKIKGFCLKSKRENL